jgi:integral membrane protein
MKSKVIQQFRYIGIAEGLSFIVLMGIAMPLKYLFGMPEAVKVTGWLHGVLFILYIFALVRAEAKLKWPLKFVAIAFLASLVPFGPFLLEPKLKKEQAAAAENEAIG